mgnify:CR=1 FL=1
MLFRSGYPISLARGAYWLGASYELLEETEFSNQFYSEAAKFPMTYYGQLAFNKINPGGNFELKDQSFFDKEYEKERKEIDSNDIEDKKSNEHLQKTTSTNHHITESSEIIGVDGNSSFIVQ